jgi:AraC-like DNA-binding protein
MQNDAAKNEVFTELYSPPGKKVIALYTPPIFSVRITAPNVFLPVSVPGESGRCCNCLEVMLHMYITINEGIFSLIIFACGIYAILTGFGQCAVQQKESINYFSALTHFTFGLFLISDTVFLSFFGMRYSILLFIDQSMLMLCVTFLHLYFRSLFLRKTYTFRQIILFFIPAALMMTIFLIQFLYIQFGKFPGFCVSFDSGPFILREKTTRIITYLWGLSCFIKSVWDLRFLRKDRSNGTSLLNTIFYIFIAFSVIILTALIVLINTDLTYFNIFYKCVLLYYSLFITMLVLYSLRYPYFFNIIRAETSRIRYSNSKVKGLNVKAVTERLQDLMETDKLYLDESLSLSKLSSILDLTPHQLSEILNSELDSNFNGFINNYRIAYAKKLLYTDPARTILNIALTSGFNSKTAFNKSFYSTVGMTPSEFRNGHAKL